MPFTIAIVGRPNVGKSTLFNRLTGRRTALVHASPGLTRDRREGDGWLGGLNVRLIDTAGYDDEKGNSLAARMCAQIETAVHEADLCLLTIDARTGVTVQDREVATILHRSGALVAVAANKCESGAGADGVREASALGFGEAAAISAEHGEGLGDLYDLLADHLDPDRQETADPADHVVGDGAIRMAIIGRPNAGKSTLINALVGSQRMITGPEAGLTRDAIEARWRWGGSDIVLVDTAGLRKRARISAETEKLAATDALRAARAADLVALTMDAELAFETQDIQLADTVLRMGRAMVLVAAKCDMVEDIESWRRNALECARRLPPAARDAPLVCTSGTTGTGLGTLMRAVVATHGNWSARIKTRDLNDWLRSTVKRHPPPTAPGGRPIRPRYISQVGTSPPRLVLMASRGRSLPASYCRYLTSAIRRDFELAGVPITLTVREGKNPYVGRRS